MPASRRTFLSRLPAFVGVGVGLATGATARSALAAEASLYRAINELRVRHGEPPLDLDRVASREAVRHASRMARSGEVFFHPDLLSVEGEHLFDLITEVVVAGADVDDLLARAVADRRTRNNLLDAYDALSVGVVAGERWTFAAVFLLRTAPCDR